MTLFGFAAYLCAQRPDPRGPEDLSLFNFSICETAGQKPMPCVAFGYDQVTGGWLFAYDLPRGSKHTTRKATTRINAERAQSYIDRSVAGLKALLDRDSSESKKGLVTLVLHGTAFELKMNIGQTQVTSRFDRRDESQCVPTSNSLECLYRELSQQLSQQREPRKQ